MDLESIGRAIRRYFSIRELVDYVAMVSRYNRIQGSSDLERAATFIASQLEELDLKVEIRRYSYSSRYGILPPVAGWDLVYGEVSMVKPRRETIHSTTTCSTVVVAHSPPGTVEAPTIFLGEVRNERDLEGIDVSNKIVIASGNTSIVYRLVQKHGAVGLVLYRSSAHEEAVPYLGLFPKPDDVPNMRIPAVAMSRKWVDKIRRMIDRGEEVVLRIVVEARYRSDAAIPVVVAKIGSGRRELHVVAHLCHPAHTVNDNVSGVATVLELARSIARAVRRKELEEPSETALTFVFFPEFYGSVAYLSTRDRTGIELCVNLDMVGEKQEDTDSTLRFVASPSFARSRIEALVFREVFRELSSHSGLGEATKFLGCRFDIVPYEGGSDHDAYLAFGIPAVMLNQWPDKYYHSHLDNVSRFDPSIASRVGIAVGRALMGYAHGVIGEEELEKCFRYYEMLLESSTMLRAPARRAEVSEEMKLEERFGIKVPPSVVTLRYFAEKLSEEEYVKLVEELDKDEVLKFLVVRYVPLVLWWKKTASVKDIIELFEKDYGWRIDVGKIRKALEILRNVDIVERVA